MNRFVLALATLTFVYLTIHVAVALGAERVLLGWLALSIVLGPVAGKWLKHNDQEYPQ